MYTPLSLFIGLRYFRAKRRCQFISFVSAISLLGMILGVFALIVVMSVMNGFEAELRGRVLSALSHGTIDGADHQLNDWRQWSASIAAADGVVGVAPYIDGTVMLSRPGRMRGAQLTAIDPEQEQTVSDLAQQMLAGELTDLSPGEYGILLGDLLARQLGLTIGDPVTVVLPKVTVTPLGLFPRFKRFTVVGLFRVGASLDSESAFIHLQDGQTLWQMGDAVKGLRVELVDLFQASSLLPQLAEPIDGAQVQVWSEKQGSLFAAIAMEKTMVALLLLIIVIVAAFNIVSILTMMVTDKRADIAVLRTMGASPRTIMTVFIVQGLSVGTAGILIGCMLGIPAALYIGDIVAWLETLSGQPVFDPQVYFISHMPSVVKWQNVAFVVLCGLLLSTLATLYPARRAAKVAPAEVLREQ